MSSTIALPNLPSFLLHRFSPELLDKTCQLLRSLDQLVLPLPHDSWYTPLPIELLHQLIACLVLRFQLCQGAMLLPLLHRVQSGVMSAFADISSCPLPSSIVFKELPKFVVRPLISNFAREVSHHTTFDLDCLSVTTNGNLLTAWLSLPPSISVARRGSFSNLPAGQTRQTANHKIYSPAKLKSPKRINSGVPSGDHSNYSGRCAAIGDWRFAEA